MNDLDLLRTYEPAIHYTLGEMFFPSAVDGYLQKTSLWLADSERKTTRVAQRGQLTTAALAEFRTAPPGHRYYLQFVDEPLQAVDYQRWRARPAARTLPRAQPAATGALGDAHPGWLVRPVAGRARARPRRYGGSGRAELPGHPGAGPAPRLLWACRAGGRLPRAALHLFLRHERLALHLQRRQRPRIRLGAGLRLSLRRRRRRPDPPLGGLCLPRFQRRRLAPALG